MNFWKNFTSIVKITAMQLHLVSNLSMSVWSLLIIFDIIIICINLVLEFKLKTQQSDQWTFSWNSSRSFFEFHTWNHFSNLVFWVNKFEWNSSDRSFLLKTDISARIQKWFKKNVTFTSDYRLIFSYIKWIFSFGSTKSSRTFW